jgi:hypothetical protein
MAPTLRLSGKEEGTVYSTLAFVLAAAVPFVCVVGGLLFLTLARPRTV